MPGSYPFYAPEVEKVSEPGNVGSQKYFWVELFTESFTEIFRSVETIMKL